MMTLLNSHGHRRLSKNFNFTSFSFSAQSTLSTTTTLGTSLVIDQKLIFAGHALGRPVFVM
jgi:hypothetical protein